MPDAISLEQITDELINDSVDSCMNDEGYLRSVLRAYFESMNEAERRKCHKETFSSVDEEV
jgi:DUF1680 family protein